VRGAHVDHALQAEARGDGGAGHAMLAGAGFGDDPGLAHAAGEQRLADGVVDLVRAGVVQVLALEQDPGAAHVARQAAGLVDGARAPDVVGQVGLERGDEVRVGARGVVGRRQLLQRAGQGLGHEAAAMAPEVAAGVGIGVVVDGAVVHVVSPGGGMSLPQSARRTSATNARIRSPSFRPGAASIPLLTSTPQGRVAAMASWTLRGDRPPESSQGRDSPAGSAAQSNARPLPPSWPPPWLSNWNAAASGKAARSAGPGGTSPPPMPTAFTCGRSKRRQKAASSPPWNWSRLGRTWRTTSRTSSALLSRNTATASTSGASAARRARASATCTRRGLPCANTKPTASTPSSPARRTSPARASPQTLTRVRYGMRAMPAPAAATAQRRPRRGSPRRAGRSPADTGGPGTPARRPARSARRRDGRVPGALRRSRLPAAPR